MVLLPLIGRSIRYKQDFATCLGETFDDIWAPNILTDRNTDAYTAKDNRSRHRTGREYPLFVENPVIRQIDLEPHGFDPTFAKQGIGIVEPALLDPGQSNQHGWTAIGGFSRQRLAGAAAGLLKSRLQDQIFRRIASQKQFREHHEIGIRASCLLACPADPRRIAGDVADNAAYLGER